MIARFSIDCKTPEAICAVKWERFPWCFIRNVCSGRQSFLSGNQTARAFPWQGCRRPEDCKYCIIAPTVQLNWTARYSPDGYSKSCLHGRRWKGEISRSSWRCPLTLDVGRMDDHHRSVAEGQRLKTGAVAPAGCVAPADTATQCRRHGGGHPTRHMTVRLCDGNAKWYQW